MLDISNIMLGNSNITCKYSDKYFLSEGELLPNQTGGGQ